MIPHPHPQATVPPGRGLELESDALMRLGSGPLEEEDSFLPIPDLGASFLVPGLKLEPGADEYLDMFLGGDKL